jgi:hypothetical protein
MHHLVIVVLDGTGSGILPPLFADGAELTANQLYH